MEFTRAAGHYQAVAFRALVLLLPLVPPDLLVVLVVLVVAILPARVVAEEQAAISE